MILSPGSFPSHTTLVSYAESMLSGSQVLDSFCALSCLWVFAFEDFSVFKNSHSTQYQAHSRIIKSNIFLCGLYWRASSTILFLLHYPECLFTCQSPLFGSRLMFLTVLHPVDSAQFLAQSRSLENIFKGMWCALDKMECDVLISLATLGRHLGNPTIGGSINQKPRSECSKCHHHICTEAILLRGCCQPVRGPFLGATSSPSIGRLSSGLFSGLTERYLNLPSLSPPFKASFAPQSDSSPSLCRNCPFSLIQVFPLIKSLVVPSHFSVCFSKDLD